ncbi:MAG: hypothetical protein JWO43_181 [Candidatus Adlerbacteria bacterium]|nr:hypothetical protein [Candidatus Adlerbacteria bacterium]
MRLITLAFFLLLPAMTAAQTKAPVREIAPARENDPRSPVVPQLPVVSPPEEKERTTGLKGLPDDVHKKLLADCVAAQPVKVTERKPDKIAIHFVQRKATPVEICLFAPTAPKVTRVTVVNAQTDDVVYMSDDSRVANIEWVMVIQTDCAGRSLCAHSVRAGSAIRSALKTAKSEGEGRIDLCLLGKECEFYKGEIKP